VTCRMLLSRHTQKKRKKNRQHNDNKRGCLKSWLLPPNPPWGAL
jgi:hypothetical protein